MKKKKKKMMMMMIMAGSIAGFVQQEAEGEAKKSGSFCFEEFKFAWKV